LHALLTGGHADGFYAFDAEGFDQGFGHGVALRLRSGRKGSTGKTGVVSVISNTLEK
jgi:hypothetical protein